MPARTPTPITRRAIALLVALMVGASLLVVASPAKAESHMPWDAPNSAWTGTIHISKTINDTDGNGGSSRFQTTATYTDLVALGSTADGGYKASVTTSGSQSSTSPCQYDGSYRFSQTWTNHQVPKTEMDSYPPLQLITDDSGNMFFTPLFIDAGSHPYEQSDCYGEQDSGDTTLDSGILTFGLRWANQVDAEVPIPDSDPDPLRLVGSRTWSNGDYPYTPYWEVDEYEYTVTYDLTLKTIPPECDTWKEKVVTWSGITPFRWMPDRHWGDYKVTAKWCYDSNADYGEVLFIRSRGTVDDGPFGLFARAANFFGFETRWENQKCEPKCGDLSDQKVRQASVSRKMAFCFDFSVLLDKLKVKDWIKEKIRPSLKSKIKAFIEANGGASGPAFSEAALTWVDDIIVKMRGKVDDVSEKLSARRVPGFLANWIEKQVEKPVNGILTRWKGDVTEDLYMGAYEDTTADVATDLMLGPFVDRIFNIFRVCDGGDFLPFTGENYPGLLTLWEPEVTVTVMGDGRARFDRFDIYKHPALDIRRR